VEGIDPGVLNTMLSCIGEAPVNDLDVTGLLDVDNAKSVLNETSRTVQDNGGEGWHFNSETDYPLIRDSDGKIASRQRLKVDTTASFRTATTSSSAATSSTTRRRAPSCSTRTSRWTSCGSSRSRSCPRPARRYIMIRAARVFQARQLGSDTQHKFSEATKSCRR
jgi:hypothetical protein